MLFHTLRCCLFIFFLIVTNMIDVICLIVEHGPLSMSCDWCAYLALNVRHTRKIRMFEAAHLLAILCDTTMHVVMASLMSSLLFSYCCPAVPVSCFNLDTI